jgi:hypothetical protein
MGERSAGQGRWIDEGNPSTDTSAFFTGFGKFRFDLAISLKTNFYF